MEFKTLLVPFCKQVKIYPQKHSRLEDSVSVCDISKWWIVLASTFDLCDLVAIYLLAAAEPDSRQPVLSRGWDEHTSVWPRWLRSVTIVTAAWQGLGVGDDFLLVTCCMFNL